MVGYIRPLFGTRRPLWLAAGALLSHAREGRPRG